jgi:hypothetical protein
MLAHVALRSLASRFIYGLAIERASTNASQQRRLVVAAADSLLFQDDNDEPCDERERCERLRRSHVDKFRRKQIFTDGVRRAKAKRKHSDCLA